MPEFLETGYPLEVKAEFDFPDERMRRLWEISVRTLKRCMHDTHEDCPYYEQLQYTLDTRLQMLFTYAVSGDARMAANVLWDYHCSRLPDGILQSRYPCTHTQVIPDFAIHWIYMLEEYALQTGGPGAHPLLQAHDGRRAGLLRAPQGRGAAWSKTWATGSSATGWRNGTTTRAFRTRPGRGRPRSTTSPMPWACARRRA